MQDRMGMLTRIILGVVLIAACGDDGTAEASPEPSEPEVRPTEASPEPASEPVPSIPEGPTVDLLRHTDSVVHLPSVHQNRTELAAQIADGDLSTAWNSATHSYSESESHGGTFLSLTVPEGAWVERVELTVGFTKTNRTRDLFMSNLRFSKVRWRKRGAEESTLVELDRDSRELQPIPINQAGTEFLFRLEDIIPGTRTDWKEICISEFRVFGRTGSAEIPAHTPRVEVLGSFEEERADPLPRELARWVVQDEEGPEGIDFHGLPAMDANGNIAFEVEPAMARDGLGLTVAFASPDAREPERVRIYTGYEDSLHMCELEEELEEECLRALQPEIQPDNQPVEHWEEVAPRVRERILSVGRRLASGGFTSLIAVEDAVVDSEIFFNPGEDNMGRFRLNLEVNHRPSGRIEFHPNVVEARVSTDATYRDEAGLLYSVVYYTSDDSRPKFSWIGWAEGSVAPQPSLPVSRER